MLRLQLDICATCSQNKGCQACERKGIVPSAGFDSRPQQKQNYFAILMMADKVIQWKCYRHLIIINILAIGLHPKRYNLSSLHPCTGWLSLQGRFNVSGNSLLKRNFWSFSMGRLSMNSKMLAKSWQHKIYKYYKLNSVNLKRGDFFSPSTLLHNDCRTIFIFSHFHLNCHSLRGRIK